MRKFNSEWEEMEALENLMLEYNIITENEYSLLWCVAGRSLDTWERALYAQTGLRSYEQLAQDLGIDESEDEDLEESYRRRRNMRNYYGRR